MLVWGGVGGEQVSAGRPCLGCGVISARSRCPTCHGAQRAKYNGEWHNQSRAAIASHVATHGWWCPGWRVDPHPSEDLTLDHQRGVMCRGCNARKRITDGE